MNYVPVIGLEIHAELNTRAKLFCGCVNDPHATHPNVNVCPVCLGHPGTLPVPNKEAVAAVIKVGLAVGGTIAGVSKFDRKNYFYPDLPKGYQISQYDKPIVSGGALRGIRIRRVHLEEDAGRLVHSPATSNQQPATSLVDFNRAGVPLMELVTEPDIKRAEEAVNFAKELQLILRYLGVSDANMEKGEMRVEANVSVGRWARGAWKPGVKTEVKNINSFKAVHDAIEYEIARQTKAIKTRQKVRQETRGWDEAKKATVSQRAKEEAHDYRYFPEPDIPPFETKIFDVEAIQRTLPELPAQKRDRFAREYGISDNNAALIAGDTQLADFFEASISELATRDERESSKIAKQPRDLLINYLTSDLLGLMNETGTSFRALKINPERLAHLVDLIADGAIGSRQAKDILRVMFEEGSDPEEILNREAMHTVSDTKELQSVVKEVLKENPQAVADYKKGKDSAIQFLIGKAMGKLQGRGNPEALKELFVKHLTPTP